MNGPGHMTKMAAMPIYGKNSGVALPVAIIAKCEEKIFLAQKNIFWRKQVPKKILP